MVEIVNLRQARKQKARLEKEREAAKNRALHGRTRDEKERDRRTAETSERFLASHRRETSGPEDDR